jgi:zinc protease
MRSLLLLGLLALTAAPALPNGPQTLTLPSDSPLVSFRILFRTGAASDPAGKEGVAALTAAMLTKGGTEDLSYDEIVETLFPMASSLHAQVDKEMTVFHGTTHIENLAPYYDLIRAMLLEPGWSEDDFRRLKDEAMNFLRIQLRSNNEEELGKEFLYLKIYEAHPYGHHNVGALASLEKLTLDDLKAFYRENYRQGNLVIGLAGGYPGDFPQTVTSDFETLPQGDVKAVELPEPSPARKLRISIIEKDTRGTLISLGFPLSITRSSPDWPALKLAQSYFGQHRTSKSYLFQRIREIRGMNYGDYAYIEYFPRGMFQFRPDPNLVRRQQIFQIWIRPVEPQNGLFALRIALYELDKLVKQGLTEEALDATRRFLSKYLHLLTQTQSDQLGYALDSQAYGTPPFGDYLKQAFASLTLEDVNRVISKHLRPTDLDIVIITKDAAGLKRDILAGKPSSIQYVSPPPSDILEEDKRIGRFPLDADSIEIIPLQTVFAQ